jgi:hypothetical protein
MTPTSHDSRERRPGQVGATAASTEIPEPSREDLDHVVKTLEDSWTATVKVARRSATDVGYREIYVSLDGNKLGVLRHGEELIAEVAPGTHELRAHNTLFRKTIAFTISVGEHASFTAVNHAGRGTYSVLAMLVGFLGAGPLYLSLERDPVAAPTGADGTPAAGAGAA